jgi:predicted DNA-binding transcriptional regulator YafY
VHEYLTTSDDMSWLVQMINSSNKGLFSELEADTKERLFNVLSSEKDIFLYQNSPFEVFETEIGQQIFRSLKSAVKNNEYRNIHYNYNNAQVLKDVKCLKLIFMENNWYVAVGRKEKGQKKEQLLFLRISFIEKVEYSSKNSYQANQLYQYIDFFKTFQNPMSLYGSDKQTALIRASSKVAKYFKPNMKKHLTSETFVEEHEDGSVDFTLEYTQAIEILPFVKKWLPDLKIISPKSLEETLRRDLTAYLQ